LAAIRLDENLIRPGGPQSHYLLVFPHYDVKNRVDLTFEFDEYLTDLIDEYSRSTAPCYFGAPTVTGSSQGRPAGQRTPICSASKLPNAFKRRPVCGLPCVS